MGMIMRIEESTEASFVNEFTGKAEGEVTLDGGPGGWFVRRIREFGNDSRGPLYRMEVSRSGRWYEWLAVETVGLPLTKEVPESTRP